MKLPQIIFQFSNSHLITDDLPILKGLLNGVKNYCEDYATKDQLEEINEILAKQIEAGTGCQG